MKIEIDLPDFPGFVPTGEYRVPVEGEYFLSSYGTPLVKATSDSLHSNRLFIYKKLFNIEEEAKNYTATFSAFDVYCRSALSKIDWSKKYKLKVPEDGEVFVDDYGTLDTFYDEIHGIDTNVKLVLIDNGDK